MAELNKLADIPIKVLVTHQQDSKTIATNLLHEMASMLNTLLTTGQSGTLDLRALPALGEEGYQFLQDKLGLGEVRAEINNFGRSEIRESAFPGIWWITHYNQNDEVYTELIEVCFVPELLKSPRDDVALGEFRLSELLHAL